MTGKGRNPRPMIISPFQSPRTGCAGTLFDNKPIFVVSLSLLPALGLGPGQWFFLQSVTNRRWLGLLKKKKNATIRRYYADLQF